MGVSSLQKCAPYEVRHPVILPRGHWVTKLIVKHNHERANHNAGVNFILSQINEKFVIEKRNATFVNEDAADPPTKSWHLYAVLNNGVVNDEELVTIFTEVEGLLNSRPLTYQSADVPLTPNHFLLGQMGG